MELLKGIILWLKEFSIEKFNNYKNKYGTAITILWIAIILAIIVSLCSDTEKFILVGLAGLLASASVMRNIQATKDLKQEEIRINNIKNLNYLAFLLYSMEKDLNDILSIIEDNIPTNYVLKQTVNSYVSLKKELLCKDLIFLLNEEEQKILKELLISSENIEIFYNMYYDHEGNKLQKVPIFYTDNMKKLKNYIQNFAEKIKIKIKKSNH
ncbi:hypothetical protein [Aliarcobacter skirrowii]|uniref:hypothetical protein n=1 Tax=Aliarcobacter skirrowii TaxID=28200 RepID=UPI0029B75B37|nr:hypothetical protein [Aliarcobacter skirrowii]MDX4028383.1 hypothetical protein [Aliarcobacter skirrowii]